MKAPPEQIPPARVLHKCARCEQTLELPGGRYEPHVWNETLIAHEARCFRVGDHVRWTHPDDPGLWIEGDLAEISGGADELVGIQSMRASCLQTGVTLVVGTRRGALRRIPPPKQKVAGPYALKEQGGDLVVMTPTGPIKLMSGRSLKVTCSSTGTVTMDAPPIHLVDGLTVESCLLRWWDNRSCLERGSPLLYDMTPAQIVEAKAENDRAAARDHAELRRRVEESKERERVQIVVDQDVEVDPW